MNSYSSSSLRYLKFRGRRSICETNAPSNNTQLGKIVLAINQQLIE